MNDIFDSHRPHRADRRVIAIRGAREHNLKNVDLEIPRDQLVVFTGLSGSGKSSLAFDTIYAEGQRRYVESLSAYARQFLEMMQKPDVDQIDGLSPAISIEQKTTSRNPRSTVGTVTEIYDYMRLLWARVGVPYSPATGLPIESQTVSQMVDRILALPEGTRLYLLAPGRAWTQRRVSQGTCRLYEARLPAREDRRPVLRDQRSAGARQEVQSRHRRGRGPGGGAAPISPRVSRTPWRQRSSSPTGSRSWSSPTLPPAPPHPARRERSTREARQVKETLDALGARRAPLTPPVSPQAGRVSRSSPRPGRWQKSTTRAGRNA